MGSVLTSGLVRERHAENSKKRTYVKEHLDDIEYRTFACRDKDEATDRERKMHERGGYLFPT
jgi:hypothetical protein